MKGTDVLSNTTIEGLHTLRLQAMASGVIEQREQPDYAALGFEDRLACSSTGSSSPAAIGDSHACSSQRSSSCPR